MKYLRLTFTVFFALTFTSAVFAHTDLSSSSPANNAMLMESPDSVELTFSAKVNLTKLEVVNQMSGDAVELSFTPSVTPNSEFSIAMPELSMGNYLVNWALLGSDGHQMTGSFGFMVHGSNMSMMEHGDSAMPSETSSESGSSENHDSHKGH